MPQRIRQLHLRSSQSESPSRPPPSPPRPPERNAQAGSLMRDVGRDGVLVKRAVEPSSSGKRRNTPSHKTFFAQSRRQQPRVRTALKMQNHPIRANKYHQTPTHSLCQHPKLPAWPFIHVSHLHDPHNIVACGLGAREVRRRRGRPIKLSPFSGPAFYRRSHLGQRLPSSFPCSLLLLITSSPNSQSRA